MRKFQRRLIARPAKAREHGVTILVGSQLILEDAGIFNRCFLLDTAGEIQARYDKLHMFDIELKNGEAYRESDAITPGDRAVIVETSLGRLGLSIVQGSGAGGCAIHYHPRRVYPDYRKGALAYAGARTRNRIRRLHHRTESVRASRRPTLFFRTFVDHRSLG